MGRQSPTHGLRGIQLVSLQQDQRFILTSMFILTISDTGSAYFVHQRGT